MFIHSIARKPTSEKLRLSQQDPLKHMDLKPRVSLFNPELTSCKRLSTDGTAPPPWAVGWNWGSSAQHGTMGMCEQYVHLWGDARKAAVVSILR